jgi:hypothetical protein
MVADSGEVLSEKFPIPLVVALPFKYPSAHVFAALLRFPSAARQNMGGFLSTASPNYFYRGQG